MPPVPDNKFLKRKVEVNKETSSGGGGGGEKKEVRDRSGGGGGDRASQRYRGEHDDRDTSKKEKRYYFITLNSSNFQLVISKKSNQISQSKDALGRKVKGRGFLRFTGRSRSRSLTPPHWRRAIEERVKKTQQTGRMRSDDVFGGGKMASDVLTSAAESNGTNGNGTAATATNGRESDTNSKRHKRRGSDEENGENVVSKKRSGRSRSRSRSREGKQRDQKQRDAENKHSSRHHETEDDSHHRNYRRR